MKWNVGILRETIVWWIAAAVLTYLIFFGDDDLEEDYGTE